MSTQWNMPITGALAALAALWAAPGLALTHSACLNDQTDGRKVCVELTSQPDTKVQASKLDGVNDTYVKYTAALSNVGLPTSSRVLDVAFTLSPAVTITEFTSSGGVCSVSGATLSCRYDKLASSQNETITMVTTTPEYAGPSTSPTLTNTGVFGFNGRTATVSKTLAVSTSGGGTWVPKNKQVEIVTHPENPDPSQQVTAEKPLFAKMIIPAGDTEFEAYLAINDNTDEDLALSCTGGLFFMANSDGGPYVCRDIGAPFDSGVGTRWIEAAIGDPNISFTGEPLKILVMWDQTIVQAAQLPPTLVAPTGTPPFAIFYHAQEPVPHDHGGTHPIRAFAETCDAGSPPCLSDVQRYGTSDWTATLNLTQIYDESEADPTVPPALLETLSSLMDMLMGVAHGIFDKGIIIK